MALHGKRALVTGGSRGVGAATVLKLAELGASVALNYNESGERADAVAATAREKGAKVVPVAGNVGVEADARRIVEEAVDALGGLDILVNNAATTHFIDFENLDGVTDQVWSEIFAVNVRGLFNVTRAASPQLKQSGEGVVVNVGSVAGVGDAGSSIPYAASKAAVHSLTRTLARVLAPEVRVNCVAPGFINTEWHAWRLTPAQHQARLRDAREETLLGMFCEPEDVADSIVSLIAHNRLATGQVLLVHGGRRL